LYREEEGEEIVALTDLDTVPDHAQRAFTSKVSREAMGEVMRGAEDEYEYARLLSTTGYAAGMWLQGRLTDRTLKMEGEVFRVAVKLRLGMACGVVSPTQTCACCGVRVDPKGWHHLYCKGSHLIARHDRLVATLAAMLRDAVGRGRVHVELLGCLTEGSGSMRMDIVVDSAAGDSMAMLDAAVCMPMADSYVGAAQVQGGAAAQRAAAKHGKYDKYIPEGSSFAAAVVEVMGGWGKELHMFWKDLLLQMDEEAEACGEDKISDSFAAKWLPRIAVSVQRGNALAIIHRARSDRAAAGRATGGKRPHYYDDSY